MFKAIWILIKLLIVTGIVVFLMEQDGTVNVAWQDYVVTINLGMSLVAITLFLVLILFIHKVIINLTSVPKRIRGYRQNRSLKKGHEAMTKSLVALAAGDNKHAAYHAHRANKLLGEKYNCGVPSFLEAQAARFMGQHERAVMKFNNLLENRESAFLGIRGLMQTEIESQNYEQALNMAYSADRMHPNQPWIVKSIYDLEIRTDNWEKLIKTLLRIEKLKVLDKEKIKDDRKAILIILADKALGKDDVKTAKKYLKKAVSIDEGFIPACTRLVHLALEADQKRKARLLIERAWKVSPHPELVKFWDLLSPTNTDKKPTARIDWYEKLISINSDSVYGYLSAVQVALSDAAWSKARDLLLEAEKIETNSQIYMYWAELEKKSTQNDDAVMSWMKKAQSAKAGKSWVCGTTNHVYDTWYAIAEPYGLFNTIKWAYPNDIKSQVNSIEDKKTGSTEDLLLCVPSK